MLLGSAATGVGIDRLADLLPTIRSRCLPVPFRSPGWRQIAARLVDAGLVTREKRGLWVWYQAAPARLDALRAVLG